MTSRFELWNNLHRAMTPLAHWYALIDNEVILELQNKVIHEVLYNRYCLIKWAPMHKQVTMLRKLLSHIFEQYTDVQDEDYISDEDIEEYPNLKFMGNNIYDYIYCQMHQKPLVLPKNWVIHIRLQMFTLSS